MVYHTGNRRRVVVFCSEVVMLKFALPLLIGFGSLAAPFGPARAQSDYPNRPVRIIVPSTPGGGTDTFARLVGQHLTTALNQTFVIDNRPGGGTLIGMDAVAHAPPDGYTLYMSPSTTTTMHIVRKAMPYDVMKALTPITQVVVLPQVLIIHPSVQAKTMAEFIALAKSQPGKLTYGTAGAGTAPHMAMELLKSMAGIDLQHVPYRGTANALTDVLAGRITGMILNVYIAKQHIDVGALRALGVTGLQRTDSLPDVPTISEAGVPSYETLQWFGVEAPAGTPAPIIKLLQTKIAEGLLLPATKARLAADGADGVGNTPEEFTALMKGEIEKWTAVAKTANIVPEE
jgi:tripartite-type tricarboxylate transporter receptor subunit TctC